MGHSHGAEERERREGREGREGKEEEVVVERMEEGREETIEHQPSQSKLTYD